MRCAHDAQRLVSLQRLFRHLLEQRVDLGLRGDGVGGRSGTSRAARALYFHSRGKGESSASRCRVHARNQSTGQAKGVVQHMQSVVQIIT